LRNGALSTNEEQADVVVDVVSKRHLPRIPDDT
jgi:hypothetical protein